jgi:hypothetical protein
MIHGLPLDIQRYLVEKLDVQTMMVWRSICQSFHRLIDLEYVVNKAERELLIIFTSETAQRCTLLESDREYSNFLRRVLLFDVKQNNTERCEVLSTILKMNRDVSSRTTFKFMTPDNSTTQAILMTLYH